MTPTQREAAARLIEGPRTSSVLWGRAVAALLRELLAEPQGEPVAWRSKTRINNDFDSNWCLTSTEPPQTPRTIAIEPLYTHPPQQRRPLTDEQVFASQNLMDLNGRVLGLAMPKLMEVIRAVERAHGIGEAP